MNNKISVVIPAYNEEKYISLCLESLDKQIEMPDEVILVDNNCTDNTVAIASKHKQIKIIKEPKQGMIFARSSGFNQAQNDIIARTDADTILPIDWVRKIKLNFEKNNIDALSGPVIFYDLPFPTPFWANLFLDIMKYFQKGRNSLIGPNMAFTKKIWDKIKASVCMDSQVVHEDIDIGMHILEQGGTIEIDRSLIVKVSGRRIRNNPTSFFIEYPIRLIRSFKNHSL